MKKKVDQGTIMKMLEWTYEKAINESDIPYVGSAYELADEYMQGNDSLEEKVDRLIRWQCLKTGTTGFLTGLGGFTTLLATLPADFVITTFVQVRMIAAIAIMGGHDVKSDKVRSLAYACLAGDALKDVLKDVGVLVGKKVALRVIEKSLSREVLLVINRAVGFRLLTKFGQKGLINLWKAVPILGGGVGCGINIIYTRGIGKTAKQVFIS